MTGVVHDGDAPRVVDGRPAVVAVVLAAADVRIVDTWDALGMRGTDSNDVVAEGVFVPAARTFAVVPAFEPAAPFRGPLYRFPAVGSVSVVVAPVALAIARGAITALRELAAHKTPVGAAGRLGDGGRVQATLAEAEAVLRSARLLFYETLAATWRGTARGEPPTLERRADLLLSGAHAVRSASRVVDMMHRLGGTSGIAARSPLGRHLRDAQTVRQHAFVSEGRFETAGQVYLGLEPDFGLVAF